MAICKKCEKKFHACSSCGMSNDWEYHYCSESCWTNSEEYLTDVSNVNMLLSLLSENEQIKSMLINVLASENATFILDNQL